MTDYAENISKSKDYTGIPLDLIKADLFLDTTYVEEDDYLTELYEIAVTQAENYTKRDIVPTTVTHTVKSFSGSSIDIKTSGTPTITGITQDGANVDAADYSAEYNDRTGILSLSFTNGFSEEDLVITYTSGYSTIPAPIRKAIRVSVADQYDTERSSYVSTSVKKMSTFEYLLDPYRLRFH